MAVPHVGSVCTEAREAFVVVVYLCGCASCGISLHCVHEVFVVVVYLCGRAACGISLHCVHEAFVVVVYLCGRAACGISSLHCAREVVVVVVVAACGTWFPDQGLYPGPLQWKRGILTTEPLGKSQGSIILMSSYTLTCLY